MRRTWITAALLAAFMVVGSVSHGATHNIIPDGAHELVDCQGCTVVHATSDVDSSALGICNTQQAPTRVTARQQAVTFDAYAARAPPSN